MIEKKGQKKRWYFLYIRSDPLFYETDPYQNETDPKHRFHCLRREFKSDELVMNLCSKMCYRECAAPALFKLVFESLKRVI